VIWQLEGDETNYWKIRATCGHILPPAKQFDGPKRIKPHERCQEWTEEAI
jgi:hypothetical protein